MFLDYGWGASVVWNEDDCSENIKGIEFGVISFLFLSIIIKKGVGIRKEISQELRSPFFRGRSCEVEKRGQITNFCWMEFFFCFFVQGS